MISISRGISVVIIIICISSMKYCIELYFILFLILISLSHTCDKMKNIFLYSSIFRFVVCVCVCVFLVFKADVKNKTCVPSGISKWTIHGLWYKLSFFLIFITPLSSLTKEMII